MTRQHQTLNEIKKWKKKKKKNKKRQQHNKPRKKKNKTNKKKIKKKKKKTQYGQQHIDVRHWEGWSGQKEGERTQEWCIDPWERVRNDVIQIE